MQREILFRGKAIDTQKWVYGFFAKDTYGNCFIMNPIMLNEVATFNWIKVIPETVGQYSGLIDKNDVSIYEDDIINVKRIYGFHGELMDEWADMHQLETINGIGTLFTGIIVHDIRKGLMLKRLDNDYMEPIFNRKQKQFCYLDMTTCKILGNIHDNPELLQSL